MWTYKHTNELYHWGKKGQKWGVRRYQNPDGTLTEAGKKRYARDAREKGYDKEDESGTRYKTVGKKNRREDLAVDADRYVTEDLTRTRKLTDASGDMARQLKSMNDASIKNAKSNRPKMDLSSMSDKQMRDEINRAILERQYNDMFSPQKSTKGREFAGKVLETAGSVLAVTGTALSIALAIRDLIGSKG